MQNKSFQITSTYKDNKTKVIVRIAGERVREYIRITWGTGNRLSQLVRNQKHETQTVISPNRGPTLFISNKQV